MASSYGLLFPAIWLQVVFCFDELPGQSQFSPIGLQVVICFDEFPGQG
jgi:hypothetical protein